MTTEKSAEQIAAEAEEKKALAKQKREEAKAKKALGVEDQAKTDSTSSQEGDVNKDQEKDSTTATQNESSGTDSKTDDDDSGDKDQAKQPNPSDELEDGAKGNPDPQIQPNTTTSLDAVETESNALGPLQLRVTNTGKNTACHTSMIKLPSNETVVITYKSDAQKKLAAGNFKQINALAGRQRFIVEG